MNDDALSRSLLPHATTVHLLLGPLPVVRLFRCISSSVPLLLLFAVTVFLARCPTCSVHPDAFLFWRRVPSGSSSSCPRPSSLNRVSGFEIAKKKERNRHHPPRKQKNVKRRQVAKLSSHPRSGSEFAFFLSLFEKCRLILMFLRVVAFV